MLPSQSHSQPGQGLPSHKAQSRPMLLLKLNVPGHGVFTSPNTVDEPEYGSPGFTLALPDANDDVGDLVNARVHSNVYPMLPFLFKRPLRHGVIFERLNYQFETFPIIYKRGSWRLETGVREQWEVLEQVLTSLATISLSHGSLRCFPIESRATPAPRSKCYLDGFSSSHSARVACMNSLHAFDLLIASCSFGIATCSTATWCEKLAVYHPTYSDLLCVSPINSFNPGSRVGVIINVSCCDWIDWVPNLVSRNIPIWLWWGTPEQPLTPPRPRHEWPQWLDNAAPSDEDRHQLLFENPSSKSHPLSAPPTPSHPSTPSHPGTSLYLSTQHRPIPHDTESAPFKGESYVDFFARRKQNTELVLQSGGQKSQLIISRMRHSLKYQCPGNAGARVFQWFFDDQGSPVRVHVPRNSIASTWDLYLDSQRDYDPLNDHWDLCLYLDLTACSPLHTTSYDITHEESIVGEDDPINEPPPKAYRINSPPPVAPPSQDRLDRDVQRMQERRSDTTDGPFTLDLIFEPLETIAYLRYGWCIAEKHTQEQPPYSLTELQTLLSHNLRRITLEGLVDPTPSAVIKMSPFFRHLSKLPTTPSQSDLCRNSPSQIHLPGTFSIDPVQVKGLTGGQTNRVVLYMVHFHGEKMPWRVAFESASSLLHCIRSSHCTSSKQLVTYCVERGIEFRTVVCFRHQPEVPPYRGFRYDGLGWRPKDYRPTLQDYTVYESIRDGFLLRQAHSRAALMKGGIIWRLAIHALGKDHVLQGPSHHMMVMGVGFLHTRLDSSFWDDDLSEGEMMLISGCYYVDTSSRNQESQLSWWPKYNIWKEGPFDAGYWTPAAESWFQHRLGQIRNSKAPLRNSSQWTASLKTNRHGRKLNKNNEVVAADFLLGDHLKNC